eukprot:5743933-Alexandrium_andersonii.AAC.1
MPSLARALRRRRPLDAKAELIAVRAPNNRHHVDQAQEPRYAALDQELRHLRPRWAAAAIGRAASEGSLASHGANEG